MQILTFRDGAELRLGVRTPRGILDVARAAAALGADDLPVTPRAFFRAGFAALPGLNRLVSATADASLYVAESGLTYGPAVSAPEKIICVGLNYRRHAVESGVPVPEVPILFSKFNNALAGHGEPVPLPSNAVEYDYEVELAVVIGRRARYVRETEALDYVLGYAVANDLSTRDLQFRTHQWLLGKTQDKFLPIGPYLVTADEVGDPQRLGLRLWLNGELRQNSNTADMVFSCAYLIHYISQYFTLEPGDIILTGTPEGVIFGQPEKNWLKPGNVVTLEIDCLGRLENRMVAE